MRDALPTHDNSSRWRDPSILSGVPARTGSRAVDPGQNRRTELRTYCDLQPTTLGQEAGVKIFRRALEEPLRQIVANAGREPAIVVMRVAAGEGSFGYNAATEEYGDMAAMGVIDPTKVTRLGLQNAASIASLILTTDCVIVERPKEALLPGGQRSNEFG